MTKQAGIEADSDIEITPEMIDAGREAFVRWFERDEHQESLVELPSQASVGLLVSEVFSAMSSKNFIFFM